jgi:hypothetical protein
MLLTGAPVALGEPGLLLPGEYPSAQVSALATSGWHALVTTDSGDAVHAVGLVHDALANDPAWVRIGIGDDTADVRFLVRDDRVAPGPVVTVVDAPRQVPQDLPLLMFLGSAVPHRIDFDCTDGGDGSTDCTLVYLHDGRRQALARYAARRDAAGNIELANDAAPAVLWTGDLDRDGALDLLLDLGSGYTESAPTLLLSSARQGDELAGEVARDTRSLALQH